MAGEADEIDEALGRLLRGLVAGNRHQAHTAHRRLYRIGAACIPATRDLVLSGSWSGPVRTHEMRYVAGLVSLVHDIDEEASRELADSLAAAGCDAAVERALRVICSRSLRDFEETECRGIRLLVHREVPARYRAATRIDSWLSPVPQGDIEDLDSILVTRWGDPELGGFYVSGLCKIRLIWREYLSGIRLLDPLLMLWFQLTLYHELGHHVHGHRGGRNPQKEEEADDYAAALMQKSYPNLRRWARLLRLPWRMRRRPEIG